MTIPAPDPRVLAAIQPSTAVRRHMHGLDFCQAVHDAVDDYPDLAMARKRLGTLITRTSTYIGPKDDEGQWVFASEAHRAAYGRKLKDVVKLTMKQGKEVQDGYTWFVLALGWAEDCYDFATSGRKDGLAHCWRIICRVLGYMYSCYEAQEGDSYQHGVRFLGEMQKETGSWA